jgi:hypothetical protein
VTPAGFFSLALLVGDEIILFQPICTERSNSKTTAILFGIYIP